MFTLDSSLSKTVQIPQVGLRKNLQNVEVTLMGSEHMRQRGGFAQVILPLPGPAVAAEWGSGAPWSCSCGVTAGKGTAGCQGAALY